MMLPEAEKKLMPHNVEYYSPMCESTVETILGLLEFEFGGKGVDLGCGTGWFVNYMNERGMHTIGIDYSVVRINVARSRYPLCGFMYSIIQEVLDTENITDWFLWDVIEHLEDPLGILDAIKGRIWASIPIQHEYVAHLQVFVDVKDIFSRLGCQKVIEWKHEEQEYALCFWEAS